MVTKLSELSTLLQPFLHKQRDVSSAKLPYLHGRCFTRKRSSLLDASQHEAIYICLPQLVQKTTANMGSTVHAPGYVLRRSAEGVQVKWQSVKIVVTSVIAETH